MNGFIREFVTTDLLGIREESQISGDHAVRLCLSPTDMMFFPALVDFMCRKVFSPENSDAGMSLLRCIVRRC